MLNKMREVLKNAKYFNVNCKSTRTSGIKELLEYIGDNYFITLNELNQISITEIKEDRTIFIYNFYTFTTEGEVIHTQKRPIQKTGEEYEIIKKYVKNI